MNQVMIAGVGLTAFGRYPERGMRSMTVAAVDAALADAGVQASAVEKIFFGNAAGGVITQQEMIRAQVALREHALAGTAQFNIENACASGGSALHLACQAICAGQAEVALVIGVEQMHHADKARAFHALHGSTDVIEIGEHEPGVMPGHSILMDFYAREAADYMRESGATVEDFARVAVKNRRHAASNPIAQFRKAQTLDDVLSAKLIIEPLTLPMCAPITDGAAAILICSASYARKLNSGALHISACQIAGQPAPGATPVTPAANLAFETAGVGPNDLDLVELHDAAAPAELMQYSEAGLCEPDEALRRLRDGDFDLAGSLPVNTSGGLLSRGHALGASGCAQVAELYLQLCGRAGERQVENARTALAINGGGWLGGSYAVTVATILQK